MLLRQVVRKRGWNDWQQQRAWKTLLEFDRAENPSIDIIDSKIELRVFFLSSIFSLSLSSEHLLNSGRLSV